jgi:hypothetical protein
VKAAVSRATARGKRGTVILALLRPHAAGIWLKPGSWA